MLALKPAASDLCAAASVAAITDDQGTLIDQQRYLPFGKERLNVGTITQTDFGYTGQRDLPSMGLMDYNARFYDSSIGRFIQPDTLIPNPADAQSWNRYGYVLNRPLNFVDPSGHCADAITAPLCVALAPLGPPGWAADAVLVTISLVLLVSLSHQAGVLLAEEVGKPLTKDEQDKIDHLTRGTDDWFKKHPDLADDIARRRAGEPPEPGRDHVKEAEDWAKGLQNDIDHLKQVRRSRNSGAQEEIDKAIEHGTDAIDRIRGVLDAKQR